MSFFHYSESTGTIWRGVGLSHMPIKYTEKQKKEIPLFLITALLSFHHRTVDFPDSSSHSQTCFLINTRRNVKWYGAAVCKEAHHLGELRIVSSCEQKCIILFFLTPAKATCWQGSFIYSHFVTWNELEDSKSVRVKYLIPSSAALILLSSF